MDNSDLFRGRTSGMLPRTTQTTFQASDLVRASALASHGGSCIPDNKLQKRRPRGDKKTRPRLPQRSRYYVGDNNTQAVRGTLLDRSVLADSSSQPGGYVRSYKHKRDIENMDSGLGLEPSSYSRPELYSTGSISDESSSVSTSSDSDDDVEMDCAHTKVADIQAHRQSTDLKMLAHETSSRIETSQRDCYAQDEISFKQRLEEIKRQASERFELNKSLQLLLPDSEGDTGFHHAIIHNDFDMLTRLLDLVAKYPHLKSSLNDQNALFQTPLHLAVHTQQTDMMRLLLKAGAGLYLTDHKGNTPLHIAARSSSSCLEEILSFVPALTILEVSQIRNNQGLTCVHLAVLASNTATVLRLKAAGVDMDMQDHNSGKTPLHTAIEMGSFQLVNLLVQSCGCDFNAATYGGCTPLHIAAGRGQIEIVAYLVSMGANPDACTDEGDTALDLSSSDPVSSFLSRVLNLMSLQQ